MSLLREIIQDAESRNTAVGHFNISDLAALNAIVAAARELSLPVVIGVSEGEREFVGLHRAVALVRSIRENEGVPVFLNADHTYSFEKVKEAVDAGFDSVIFDGAQLPLEENIRIAKQCVEYARSKNLDILVEGELGFIGTSSKLLEAIPEGASITEELMTTSDEAREFVEKTGVDLLAPAVGNIHGMLKSAPNPKLDTERIRAIRDAAGVPLVLHGGSGISDEDFRSAIEAGISVIHINTEIRLAWRQGLERGLAEHPEEIAPYKIFPSAVEAVAAVVAKRMKLFSGKS